MSYWRGSKKIAQAFLVGKKLNEILKLPEKVERLRLERKETEETFFLKDIKIHQALGVRILMEQHKKRSYQISDYRLVCRGVKRTAIHYLAQDVLRLFVVSNQANERKSGQSEWVDIADLLQHAKNKSIFSTRHELSYTWIPEACRRSPDIEYECIIKRPSGIIRKLNAIRFHPWERVKAFFWTLKNYARLVEAGIISD